MSVVQLVMVQPKGWAVRTRRDDKWVYYSFVSEIFRWEEQYESDVRKFCVTNRLRAWITYRRAARMVRKGGFEETPINAIVFKQAGV